MKSSLKRVTVMLPTALLERLRNAVFWTPGLTVNGLIESAISLQLCDLETKNGGPYPVRTTELKGGRPRKKRG